MLSKEKLLGKLSLFQVCSPWIHWLLSSDKKVHLGLDSTSLGAQKSRGTRETGSEKGTNKAIFQKNLFAIQAWRVCNLSRGSEEPHITWVWVRRGESHSWLYTEKQLLNVSAIRAILAQKLFQSCTNVDDGSSVGIFIKKLHQKTTCLYLQKPFQNGILTRLSILIGFCKWARLDLQGQRS